MAHKSVVFTFGRFQPITKGHEKVINKVRDHAQATGAESHIYTSHSEGDEKNPLPYRTKIKHLKALFPEHGVKDDHTMRSPHDVAKKLSDQGYEHVTMVVGQDRVEKFKQAIGKYVRHKSHPEYDPKKHYSFKKFEVVSAGKRDPNASGVEGLSGTKMREHAKNNNFKEFAHGIPGNNLKIKKDIFRHLQKHMTEENNPDKFDGLFWKFVDFAKKHLDIKDGPHIDVIMPDQSITNKSFGGYHPDSKQITVLCKNRHPMDIFRTVAHELVHHKQNLEGRIKDAAKEGSTGSEIENEANFTAGIIMRNFAQENPDVFGQTAIAENKLASGHVSAIEYDNILYHSAGKHHYEVMKKIFKKHKIKSNSGRDNIADKMKFYYHHPEAGDSIDDSIPRRTIKTPEKVVHLKEGVHDPNIFKAIFLAGGPGSGKDFILQKIITGNGLVEINSDIAFEFLMKKEGLSFHMPEIERPARDLVRGRAKNVSKEKQRLSLSGRLGLVINGTADDFNKIDKIKKDLEALGYDTMMVFVNTTNEISQDRNVARGQRGGRMVPELLRKQKWENAQVNIGHYQNLFGVGRFLVLDNSIDARKLTPEEKKLHEEIMLRNFKFIRAFLRLPVNGIAHQWIEAQKGKHKMFNEEENIQELSKELLKRYVRKATINSYDQGFRHGNKAGKKNRDYATHSKPEEKKVTNRWVGVTKAVNKLAKEDVDTLFEKQVIGNHKYFDKNSLELGLPEVESIKEWAFKDSTLSMFSEKYGVQAQDKLLETANRLAEAYQNEPIQKKTVTQFKQKNIIADE